MLNSKGANSFWGELLIFFRPKNPQNLTLKGPSGNTGVHEPPGPNGWGGGKIITKTINLLMVLLQRMDEKSGCCLLVKNIFSPSFIYV